jgi:hypothetical protein
MHQIVSLIFLMIIFEVTEHGTNLWHVCKAVFLRKEKRLRTNRLAAWFMSKQRRLLFYRVQISPFPQGLHIRLSSVFIKKIIVLRIFSGLIYP